MTGTTITVQGSFESFHPAERATVHVGVGFEGPDRETVVAGTTRATQALVAGIQDRHDPERGPVTWWASDRIRVWSTRPFHDKGEQLPLVHHALTATRAKFRDFEELARWVERAATHHGVRIDGIDWALTEATRTSTIADVRRRAVEDARAKAQEYAAALGLSGLTCVALADPGMLGDQVHGGGGGPVGFARVGSAGADAGGLELTPEDISVSASVDARFVAS
jgi:uncharacterized protein YggE